ncbi:MAG: hypothetical protein ACE5KF_12805 [Kiloniellaceae bacterium]
MSLSKHVVETLIDLVEIKLSCVEVYDREDSREVKSLEHCRRELEALAARHAARKAKGAVVAFPQPKSRPRAAL